MRKNKRNEDLPLDIEKQFPTSVMRIAARLAAIQDDYNDPTPGTAALKLFDPERHPHEAYIACRDLGATEKQMGLLFGVHEKTLISWKHKFPLFKDWESTMQFEQSTLPKLNYARAVKSPCFPVENPRNSSENSEIICHSP